MVQPELIILVGSFLWGIAALVTGGLYGYAPSELPFVFAVVSAIGALIGVSEWVPESVDVALTYTAGGLYLVAPVALTVWILHRNEPEDREPEDPKTYT